MRGSSSWAKCNPGFGPGEDDRAELGDRLGLTGHQPMDRFYLYMLASDVVVNLRFPSTGELSGTLIRTLGMGKPVLVSNTGPFAEFPEHTVARIDLGPPRSTRSRLRWIYWLGVRISPRPWDDSLPSM